MQKSFKECIKRNGVQVSILLPLPELLNFQNWLKNSLVQKINFSFRKELFSPFGDICVQQV